MMKKKSNLDDDSSISHPWIEKYRPKKINEVVFQNEIVNVLKNTLNGADFPNFLFYGPPGTGKTSTILALAREIYDDQFKQRILELNASDERGIAVIREKIKIFAQQSTGPLKVNGKEIPSFKLIILDEADSMTAAAQSALRRVMEKESKNTRFCLICNYISRIIEPIASRCAKFRFKPLNEECIIEKLEYICKLENLNVGSNEIFVEMCNISEGDLRKAITLLQTIYRMNPKEKKLDLRTLHEISGYIPSEFIYKILDSCKKGSYEEVNNQLKNLIYEGYSATQFLAQLNDWILSSKCFLDDKKKSKICEEIGKSDLYLIDNASEYLQCLKICSDIIECCN